MVQTRFRGSDKFVSNSVPVAGKKLGTNVQILSSNHSNQYSSFHRPCHPPVTLRKNTFARIG